MLMLRVAVQVRRSTLGLLYAHRGSRRLNDLVAGGSWPGPAGRPFRRAGSASAVGRGRSLPRSAGRRRRPDGAGAAGRQCGQTCLRVAGGRVPVGALSRRARRSGLSGTSRQVPSIATVSKPLKRAPLVGITVAGPRSRSNRAAAGSRWTTARAGIFRDRCQFYRGSAPHVRSRRRSERTCRRTRTRKFTALH